MAHYSLEKQSAFWRECPCSSGCFNASGFRLHPPGQSWPNSQFSHDGFGRLLCSPSMQHGPPGAAALCPLSSHSNTLPCIKMTSRVSSEIYKMLANKRCTLKKDCAFCCFFLYYFKVAIWIESSGWGNSSSVGGGERSQQHREPFLIPTVWRLIVTVDLQSQGSRSGNINTWDRKFLL